MFLADSNQAKKISITAIFRKMYYRYIAEGASDFWVLGRFLGCFRYFLETNRISVKPRLLHWYNRRKYNAKPCGIHLNVAMTTLDAVSLKISTSKQLLGEKDKLLQSITGGNGYGGHGLDVVYGVPSSVGVRVHRTKNTILPEILPLF